MPIVIIVLFVILMIYLIIEFNKLVKASNLNRDAFINVDIALKKRYNLIPNVEKIVKAYPTHERDTLENVLHIKDSLSNKMTIENRQREEDKFSDIIKDMFMSINNYPQLRNSQYFLKFQNYLMQIEEEINTVVVNYNDSTKNYNVLIEKFPINILAKLFGFDKRSYFDVDLLMRGK